jgi:hypothetical protein
MINRDSSSTDPVRIMVDVQRRSLVQRVCTAYESGMGRGLSGRDIAQPYEPTCAEGIGYELGWYQGRDKRLTRLVAKQNTAVSASGINQLARCAQLLGWDDLRLGRDNLWHVAKNVPAAVAVGEYLTDGQCIGSDNDLIIALMEKMPDATLANNLSEGTWICSTAWALRESTKSISAVVACAAAYQQSSPA